MVTSIPLKLLNRIARFYNNKDVPYMFNKKLKFMPGGNYIPPKEAILGMVALKSLSYKFKVGGKNVYQTIKEIKPDYRGKETANLREDIPFLEDDDITAPANDVAATKMKKRMISLSD
uniref:Uncharacterized protein n=1 Tax=Megaselia scalaris TaxID=36166 RepID=T1GR48_MEGSC